MNLPNNSILRQWFRPDVLELFDFIQRRFGHARLPQVAGNLTFVTLLALVPLLTIALAVFTMFPQFGTLQKMLEAYFQQVMMPKHIETTIMGYLTAFSSKATRLSLVGAGGLLFGAVAMVSMMESAFNQVWRIRQQRPFVQRHLLLLSIAILGPFVGGVSLMMTSSIFVATGSTFKQYSIAHSAFFTLLSIIWMTGSFTLLYIVLPNRNVHWREAICGGLFAAIALEITKRIFAAFIVAMPTYRVVYGAMAAVPIFLLWIYLSWLITLAGAAVSAILHFIWHCRWRHHPTPGSTFIDAMSILRVLHNMRCAGDVAGVDESRVRAATGLGLDEIDLLLAQMQREGWVAEAGQGASRYARQLDQLRTRRVHRWVLQADPAQLTVADVYRVFVFAAPDDTLLARHVRAVMAQGLNQTIAAYFARNTSAT